MTFYEVSQKMLLANFSRYRIYFFSNLFAAALFYCFASIFTNQSFMNGKIVNPLISSNIYFPSILADLFLLFFLPLSCQVFVAARKKEYGILFSLGMSRREAFWRQFCENVLVTALALAAALAAGTLLSWLFFGIIRYGISIVGVKWGLSLEQYKITAFLYLVALAPAFIFHAGSILREKISFLLKAPALSEKEGVLYRMLCRCCSGYMRRHMAEWSFLRRHSREWRIRSVLAFVIVSCSVILVSVSVTMSMAFLRDAKSYSPYDMVYSEMDERHRVLEGNVAGILAEYGVVVEQIIRIPYVRNASFNCFPVEKVNQYFQCAYQVKDGQFLNLFQYDLQDGYEHEMQPISEITYNGNRQLRSAGSDVRILWNQNPAFADRTLLVSDSDFEKLQKDAEFQVGVAHWFLFDQWEDSYDGICAVKEYMSETNQNAESEAAYYEVSSKVEYYQDAQKSGRFLIFLIAFIVGLMMMAEFLLIHFRIQAEQEENNRAVLSLRMIGVTDQEVLNDLKYKNRLRFILPVILGTVFSFLPCYFLNEAYSAGFQGAFAGAVFGIGAAGAEVVILGWYSKREFKAMKG